MIRLQNNVPEPYVDQSRDFQLMVRLYDAIVNGVKFDIDTVESVINSRTCSSRLLSLLQTKLGFFSTKDIADSELRYVLLSFPYIVKNKGSLLAIKQAIWTYLKLKHMKTTVSITVTSKNDVVEPCVVKIGLRTGFTDITILDEILKYVIPTGYTLQYYFYTDINNRNADGNVKDPMIATNSAKTIIISDAINSGMRDAPYSNSTENRIIGAVDTTEIFSSEEPSLISNLYDTVWQLNNVGDFTNLSAESVNFMSNDIAFSSLAVIESAGAKRLLYITSGSQIEVWNSTNGFSDDVYRNIHIVGNDYSNVLKLWLCSNAVIYQEHLQTYSD